MKTAEEAYEEWLEKPFEGTIAPVTVQHAVKAAFIEGFNFHQLKPVDRAKIEKLICKWLNIRCSEREIAEYSVSELTNALLPYFGTPVVDIEKAIKIIMSEISFLDFTKSGLEDVLNTLVRGNVFHSILSIGYTEQQMKDYARVQRDICAENAHTGLYIEEYDGSYDIDKEIIRNLPEPPLPTK